MDGLPKDGTNSKEKLGFPAGFVIRDRLSPPGMNLVFALQDVTSAATFVTVNVSGATAINSPVSGGAPLKSHFGHCQEWGVSS